MESRTSTSDRMEAQEDSDDQQATAASAVVLADRDRRLVEKGLTSGNPVMIRIFKAESELELWMQKDDRFELFATYPICNWSGDLGPKLHEGDKQSPEGLYSIGPLQLHRRGRWPRSLDIGFPNALDRAHARTGSYILVHGGCTSTGCFAMTNPVMEEIYSLTEQALRHGQEQVQVHVFPFRMTEVNLAAHANEPWQAFWRNLKEAYDLFERTRVPPKVSVCSRRYVVAEQPPHGEESALANSTPWNRIARLFRPSISPAPMSSACVENEPSPLSFARGEAAGGRKAPSRIRSRYAKLHAQRRAAKGRNARKAYAAARAARMAAHAKRMRTTYVSGSRRAH